MAQTVKDGWQDYNDRVLPANAGPTQRTETRHAFYAGAWMVLMILSELGEADVSEDEAVKRLAAMIDEVKTYYRAVGAKAS